MQYDNALMQPFYLSVALAALGLVGTSGIEWRGVWKKKV